MPGSRKLTVRVEALARVEGEGALHLRVHNGQVREVRLEIYEPPRFFEAFLRGRRLEEAPDITARICGICPVAYQMSACNALESLLGLSVGGPIRDLRLLLYYGEWIESHALHMFLLHLPDFLGYESALHMARDHPDWVQKGLQIKKAGNALMARIGGREVHPINVRVGGFYSVPSRRALLEHKEELARARDLMVEALRWMAGLEFPEFEEDYEFVALYHPEEYAILEGQVRFSHGLLAPVSAFEEIIEEIHVPYSNALHAVIRGRGSYMVGPLARFNLNFSQLSPLAREVAVSLGLTPPVRNPFRSLLVRGIEVIHACEEALRLIDRYEPPDRPFEPFEVRAGTGFGASEAHAGPPVSPLSGQRGGPHRGSADHPAHLPEPAPHRGRSAQTGAAAALPAPGCAHMALRAGHPELRSLHLLRHPLPAAGACGGMNAGPRWVLIGLGNPMRRDDGVGPWVAAQLQAQGWPAWRAVPMGVPDPVALAQAWAGVEVAWIVDAVEADAPPGTLLRLRGEGLGAGRRPRGFSTHGLDPVEAIALARTLGPSPRRVVLYGIVGADFGFGEGLSPAVEAGARRLLRRLERLMARKARTAC
jgi:sulfhydrogenase subunit alpha